MFHQYSGAVANYFATLTQIPKKQTVTNQLHQKIAAPFAVTSKSHSILGEGHCRQGIEEVFDEGEENLNVRPLTTKLTATRAPILARRRLSNHTNARPTPNLDFRTVVLEIRS